MSQKPPAKRRSALPDDHEQNQDQVPTSDAVLLAQAASPVQADASRGLMQVDVGTLLEVSDQPSSLPPGAGLSGTAGEQTTSTTFNTATTAASSSGIGWGWYAAGGLGVAAAAGGGGGGGGSAPASAPASATLAGTIVAGPLIAGHGLSVTAYQANGTTVLGSSATASNDGSYSINIGAYTGVVIVKVTDSTLTADYRDEGTNANKDLNAELIAVSVVTTAGTLTLHITPLTTVAYHKLGANPVALDVTNANNGVANAFGLNGIDITTTLPVTVFDGAYDPNGGLNNGERYGAMLAAVAGMDVNNGHNSQQTINQLAAGLTGSNLNPSTLQSLNAGTTVADNALSTDLSAAVVSVLPALDNVAPTLTISDNVAGTANGPITYIFTFSEAVTGFTADDISVSAGTKGTLIGSGTTYTLAVTPPNTGSGTITVDVAAGVAADVAGNGNLAAAQSSQPYNTTAPDTTAPTVTITDNVVGTATGDITYIFTFSEAVTGFTADDISVSAGTKGAFAGSGTTYTLLVAPPASGSGSISVGVAANVAIDGASNGNVAATTVIQAYDRGTQDTTAPLPPVINSVATDNLINASETGASITGTAEANSTISLSIGGNTRTAAADAGGNWAYTLVAADITAMGQGAETLSATARDAAGNISTAGTRNITVDTAVPNAPVISTVATDDIINASETTSAISGTAEANATINLTIGANTRTVTANAGGTWTYTLVAADITAMGQGAETLSATARDAAGNVGTAGTRNITVDTTAPVVAITDNAVGTAVSDVTYTFTFSEAVTGFTTADVTVTNGAKGVFTAVSGTVYTLVVTPTPASSGNITVDVGAGLALDGAGNSYTAAVQSVQVFDTRNALDLSAIATGAGGFVISGQCANDWSGRSVASAGDVNGDGLDDLIIGAPNGDVSLNDGRTYVVFGVAATTPIDLSAIAAGSGGFVINGAAAEDQSGFSVAGAGDLNGDGLTDLLVGANKNNAGGANNAGKSYVVYGKNTTTPVNLGTAEWDAGTTTEGFAVWGAVASDYSGYSVATAGDINGDGLGDLIISAHWADPTLVNAGRSYIVFGQAANAPVLLSNVASGTGGFVINGQASGDNSGFSVSGAGDVNGDGLADLIVSAPNADPLGGVNAGRSYLVFGKANTTAVDLSVVAAGTGGFVINGVAATQQSGWSVAGIGDINGDGLADLAVGAPQSDPAGRTSVSIQS